MTATVTRRPGKQSRRCGAAAVELALLLPLLTLLVVLVVDFGRIFYHSIMLTNCARNGALYAADPTSVAESRYPNLTAAESGLPPSASIHPISTARIRENWVSPSRSFLTHLVTPFAATTSSTQAAAQAVRISPYPPKFSWTPPAQSAG